MVYQESGFLMVERGFRVNILIRLKKSNRQMWSRCVNTQIHWPLASRKRQRESDKSALNPTHTPEGPFCNIYILS